MRKFKCLHESYNYITEGKVYDALDYIERRGSFSDLLFIKNDIGDSHKYIINSVNGRKIFEEVTAEYRNVIIDGILS